MRSIGLPLSDNKPVHAILVHVIDEESTRRIGDGFSYQDIHDAVKESGFPLQATVVDYLRRRLLDVSEYCDVREEWPFTDDESGETRRLDAIAEIPLKTEMRDNEWIYTLINYLVECKQSGNPYVFYLRGDTYLTPTVTGSSHELIEVAVHGDPTTASIQLSVQNFANSRIQTKIAVALSFRKALREKGRVRIDSEHTFREISMPMIKALRDIRRRSQPGPNQCYQHVRMIFPLVVLRAPMIGARIEGGEIYTEPLKWVRIPFEVPTESGLYSGVEYFDVVDEQHLDEYIDQTLAIGEDVNEKILTREAIVLSGTAAVDISSLEGDTVSNYLKILETCQPTISALDLQTMQHEKMARAHSGTKHHRTHAGDSAVPDEATS